MDRRNWVWDPATSAQSGAWFASCGLYLSDGKFDQFGSSLADGDNSNAAAQIFICNTWQEYKYQSEDRLPPGIFISPYKWVSFKKALARLFFSLEPNKPAREIREFFGLDSLVGETKFCDLIPANQKHFEKYQIAKKFVLSTPNEGINNSKDEDFEDNKSTEEKDILDYESDIEEITKKDSPPSKKKKDSDLRQKRQVPPEKTLPKKK